MEKTLAVGLCVLLSGCPKDSDGPDPKQQAEGLYLAGTAAFLQGNFKDAHERFDEVKKLNPTDPRLPAAVGEVYLAEVKLNDALASFEQAVKVDPKRGTTWSRIGYIQSLLGHKEEAVKALDKALELNPRDFNALEARAEVQLKDGQFDEAIKSLLLAAEASPDLGKSALVLRVVSELSKKGRGAEALSVLEAQVGKGLKSPEVMAEFGDQLVVASRLGEARDAYTAAAKGNPKDPTLWELVGELEVRLDRPAEAEAAFRESLKIKDRGVVHVGLARLCQGRKDDACVKAELDQALQTASGEEPRELVDLSDLLASVGRTADAMAIVKALADEPEQKGDWALQLKAAALAKKLNDKEGVKTWCANAQAADAGIKKCP